jgi:hypothetical protein
LRIAFDYNLGNGSKTGMGKYNRRKIMTLDVQVYGRNVEVTEQSMIMLEKVSKLIILKCVDEARVDWRILNQDQLQTGSAQIIRKVTSTPRANDYV